MFQFHNITYFHNRNIFLLTIFSTLLLAFFALPYGTGDTAELVQSTLTFKSCLSDFKLYGCSEMERFGFTPHLITLLLWSVFKDVAATITAWTFINFIFYCLIIYYIYTKTKENKFFKVSILIFSPLTAYAVYSFNEMTYIFAIFLLILSIKNNKFVLSIILSLLASAFKETSIILILPIILIALVYKKEKINFKTIVLILSSISGFIFVYIFNFYKYSQFINDEYQTAGRVNEIGLIISNFFGLLFSPSGGIFGYFWISSFIALSYYLINKEDYKIKSLVILTLLVNLLILAFWFSPFGWVAWGPRLIIPTLVSLILCIFIFEIDFQFNISIFLRTLFVFGNIFATFSLLGFLVNSDVFKNWLNQVVYLLPNCPKLYVWEIERAQYIKCMYSMTWESNSLNLISLNSFFTKLFDFKNFGLISALLIISITSMIIRNLTYLIKAK